MSETKSDAARAQFREGMRRFSLAYPSARESLDGAIEQAPEFASAHLQRALFDLINPNVSFDDSWAAPDPDEARSDFRAAMAARARLPYRDQQKALPRSPRSTTPQPRVATLKHAELSTRAP